MSLSLDSSGGVAYVPLEGTHIDSRRHPTDPLGYGTTASGQPLLNVQAIERHAHPGGAPTNHHPCRISDGLKPSLRGENRAPQ